jgi:N-methylhydantoinase B
MVTDSAGPGKHRGGCGVRLEVEFLGRGQIITMETSRTREGSPGVNGGGRSSRQRQQRRRPDGSLETIGGLADDGTWLPQMLGNVGFKPGESFVFDSCGGGGWGDPLTRDPERVARDVRNELVSRRQAEQAYGVILTESLEIDADATAERRGRPTT